jgi:hypothetical protein
MRAHPNRTNRNPEKKQPEATFLSLRMKNRNVFCGPRRKVRPTRNDKFPRDMSVRSNMNITPKNMHTEPIKHRPTPISRGNIETIDFRYHTLIVLEKSHPSAYDR